MFENLQKNLGVFIFSFFSCMTDISIYRAEVNNHVPVRNITPGVSFEELSRCIKHFPRMVNGQLLHGKFGSYDIPPNFQYEEGSDIVSFFERNPRSKTFRLVALGIVDSISEE